MRNKPAKSAELCASAPCASTPTRGARDRWMRSCARLPLPPPQSARTRPPKPSLRSLRPLGTENWELETDDCNAPGYLRPVDHFRLGEWARNHVPCALQGAAQAWSSHHFL